jgi:lactate dehydrogenase-like 2-hydroxyacid dehydrogenase
MTPDTRPAVLLAMKVSEALAHALAERYEVVGPLPGAFEATLPDLDAQVAGRVRALVTMGTVGASAAAMDRLPQLGVVACLGSGYENVDLAAARARGIAVAHAPGANAESVADVALGLLIASVRQFGPGRVLIDSGAWRGNAGRALPLARGLMDLHVGIYGLGAIGSCVARRVAACGSIVAYHGRRRHDDVDHRWFDSLRALAEWSDALVISVRANAANRHAVDAGVLRALGAQGHVVNVARGSVIDEAALITALTEGTLGGAGLDVFEHEPDVPARLLALPNVVVTPHLGGATRDAQAAMQALLLRNLAAHFAGEPLVTPVGGAASERS